MESWRKCWREGVEPLLSDAGLAALARGLRDDDPRLIQGGTCDPPPLMCVSDWPVTASDAITYAFWQGDASGDCTVVAAAEYFARICFECDQRLNEPAGCRWFLNWYDETPRDEMRQALLAEVGLNRLNRSGLRLAHWSWADAIAVGLALDYLNGDSIAKAALADLAEEAGDTDAARDIRALPDIRPA